MGFAALRGRQNVLLSEEPHFRSPPPLVSPGTTCDMIITPPPPPRYLNPDVDVSAATLVPGSPARAAAQQLTRMCFN